MTIRARVIPGILLAFFSILPAALADIIITTDEATYIAELANLGLTASIEDFESTAAGTLIPNGSTLGLFTYDGFPAGTGVDDAFFTTSGSNSLGIPSGGTFTTGGFTLSFPAASAFAMRIVTSNKPPTLSNDDYTLQAGGQNLNINIADSTFVAGIPPFSSESYFFGIINTDAAFRSATFVQNSVDDLNFFIDDLQLAGLILLGDVNLDGEVNLLDVDPFIDRLASGTYQAEADVNQDGEVNLLDVDPFIAVLAGG